MKIENPYMSAARRSGDPVVNRAKKNGYLKQGQACITDRLKYRLHYNETPIGLIVVAAPMEINAWNANARAYYSHQITLGRDRLPILEWKKAEDNSGCVVWRVRYKNNGVINERLFTGKTKAEAKREFEATASVACVVVSITEDEDMESAVEAARAINTDGGDE